MRLPLTKLDNITLTMITIPLTPSPLCLLMLVRLGRLHSEFVRLLFLQAHRETDRFLAASGVQLAQHDRGQFHYRRSGAKKAHDGRLIKIADLFRQPRK